MPSAKEIRIENVSKYYGDKLALKEITLSVRKGEFMTVLGPSGCGKTSLLNIIAGFIEPTEGDIYVKGERINDVPSHKRNIGMVFQNYALFPHMDVFDNLAFGLHVRKLSKERIREEVKNALDTVRLPGYEHRRVHQLSGGEQQRIALARAIIVDPSIILLDEPLSNLDARLRKDMRVELKLLQKRLGTSTILVTHDQEEALSLSDRMTVIGLQHTVEQIGTPMEIYKNPRTRFVSGFIGEMNCFEGEISSVDSTSNEISFVSDGLTFWIRRNEKIGLKEGDKATVILRPQATQICEKAEKSKNTFPGVIENTMFLGTFIQYAIRLNNGKRILVSETASDQEHFYKIADKVFVLCEPSALSLI